LALSSTFAIPHQAILQNLTDDNSREKKKKKNKVILIHFLFFYCKISFSLVEHSMNQKNITARAWDKKKKKEYFLKEKKQNNKFSFSSKIIKKTKKTNIFRKCL